MDAKKIQEAYRRKLQNDSQLKQIRKKVADGDLSALQKYSIRAGELSAETLQDSADDFDGSEEEAINAVFRANYQAVENASQTAQKSANESSGFGLNPSTAAYVSTAAVFASKLSGYEDIHEGLNALKYDIVLQSQRYADDSERRSADFASNSGVEVLVSREYDDVGVHTTDKGGGEDCQWCKARCGTDVPYKEAYARGMFERHPGCGCIITYKTKRGVFRQGKGDWQANIWSDITETERNQRISFAQSGDNIGSSLRTPRQREFEAELTRQGANRLHDVILQDPTVLADYTPSSLKTALESHGVTVLDSLGQGDYKGVPFESGGGYRALFGGDGTFRYHPSERSHHGGAYYRLSKQDVQKWYTLDGVEFDGHNGGIGATNKK